MNLWQLIGKFHRKNELNRMSNILARINYKGTIERNKIKFNFNFLAIARAYAHALRLNHIQTNFIPN